YEGPTVIATWVSEATRQRGLQWLALMGQAPHYLQGATNPAVSQALLRVVARLLGVEVAVSHFDAAVQAFGTRCDEAGGQEAAIPAYVRPLEQDYDAPGAAAARPPPQAALHPEPL